MDMAVRERDMLAVLLLDCRLNFLTSAYPTGTLAMAEAATERAFWRECREAYEVDGVDEVQAIDRYFEVQLENVMARCPIERRGLAQTEWEERCATWAQREREALAAKARDEVERARQRYGMHLNRCKENEVRAERHWQAAQAAWQGHGNMDGLPGAA